MDMNVRMKNAAELAMQLRSENDELNYEIDQMRGEMEEARGRLRECRRINKALRRECAKAQGEARLNRAYVRQLVIATGAVTAAVTCLIHTLILWLA